MVKVFGFLLVALVLVAIVFGTSQALAGIAGSAHDFSLESWSTNDICGPCHTPHNSVSGGAPLWNHTNTTYSTWTMYDNTNGTQDSSVPINTALGPVSKACLSCHDGTTAVDAFGGATGTVKIAGAGPYVSMLTVGGSGDLSSDQPISITYDTALSVTDGGLHDPTNAVIAKLLIDKKIECSSCHDVHNAGGFASLLRVDNTDSALCLTCHDK
jgi:predicted CXXCH cytochrome family protein